MGYVHDTGMSQFIPPTAFHPVTGTFTFVAGQVAGTIVLHRAAANQTSVITIPIIVPSNSAVDAAGLPNKGALLKSIDVDYEILVAEPTSITWTLNKVKRGADGAVAVVSAITKTESLSAATAKAVDQHKNVITITTPAYVENDEYYLLQFSMPAGAGGNTTDFLGAVANYTFKA